MKTHNVLVVTEPETSNRKYRLFKKLDNAGLSPLMTALKYLSPDSQSGKEILDKLTHSLTVVATMAASMETNRYVKMFLKTSSYLICALNLYSSITSLFRADENCIEQSEENKLLVYFQGHLNYRSHTFNERSVVNMELFRRALPSLLNITDLFEVSSISGDLTSTEPQEFIKKEISTYMLIIEHSEVEYLITMNWRSPKDFIVYGPSEDKCNELVQSCAAKLLQSLQANLIEITSTDKYSYDDIHALKLFDLNPPDFHDKCIFDSLYPALKNSMEKKIKTGVLIHGLPGLSKTTTVRYILSQINAVKVKVNNDAYKVAKKVLSLIQAPKIVLIDDIDISNNEDKDDEVSALLDFLDSDCYDIVIMIANTLNLSPTIIRSGRCDIILQCLPPDAETRQRILEETLAKTDLDVKAPSLSKAVRTTNGMTHADLHNVVKTMSRYNDTIEGAISKVRNFISQTATKQDEGS